MNKMENLVIQKAIRALQRAFREGKISCDDCQTPMLPRQILHWSDDSSNRCVDCYWKWDSEIKRLRHLIMNQKQYKYEKNMS
jgi:hypothetical protein